MSRTFRPGDYVIYRKHKYSSHPSRKARDVWPSANGDQYCYCVEKFYRVVEIGSENQVIVISRRGRRHTFAIDDPALRPASWLSRMMNGGRFPDYPTNPETQTP